MTKYIARHPKLQTIIDSKKGERVDVAEGVLWQKVQAGEPWAVIFFLKTQGRERGYTEKYDFSHEFKGMSDAELIEWIAQRTGADGSRAAGSREAGFDDPEKPTVH